MKRGRYTIAALLLAAAMPLYAQHTPWHQLPSDEQTALKPYQQQWQQMTPEQQQRLRRNANRWQQMSPEEKQRTRERAERFRQLPPQEQQRLKVHQRWFQSLPPEERERLRGQWRQMSPEERSKFMESRPQPPVAPSDGRGKRGEQKR
jgi:hypothetical protein